MLASLCVVSVAHAAPAGEISATPSVTRTKSIQVTPLRRKAHPVAAAIAQYYRVSVAEVEAIKASGPNWGYGNIIKLYSFAQMANTAPAEIKQLRDAGLSWTAIASKFELRGGASKSGRVNKVPPVNAASKVKETRAVKRTVVKRTVKKPVRKTVRKRVAPRR